MLNRAVGGAYGYTTDIGGYEDLYTGPTSKELLLRWAEWAALSPFFRLHNSGSTGTQMPWDFDQETIDDYRMLSQLHQRAAPLILSLWQEAQSDGLPPTRPLWLAYPNDPVAAQQDQEWLLGPDVLVAPVVTEGATTQQVYLPTGCWTYQPDGSQRAGGATVTVAAPLGTLPYFFHCGTTPF
ncbi:MAG: hypothetical protein JOY51_00565 [Nevskia sp.]|nr:hypothetical protein [Nevskia sp.]